jgi:dihydroorotate dehydrogenase (NAD+) catalytic subunit
VIDGGRTTEAGPHRPNGGLEVKLGPIALRHPIINASGTMEILDLAEVYGLEILRDPPVAAYVPKTITVLPRVGNLPPRIVETAGGMVNSVGLPGPGLEAFVSADLPRLLALPCPVILSVGGFSSDEYVSLARTLHEAVDRLIGEGWSGRVGLELNVSCPNVHLGCAQIGSDPGLTQVVVEAVRSAWPGLLVVKLTPNVADIVEVGVAAEAGGADAVAAVNTYKALVVDRVTLKPYLGNIGGGLSGPAIKPLALRAVYDLFERLNVPIVGMGGIGTVQDVLDMLSCGARVVAIGSCSFTDPHLGRSLAVGLSEALRERGLSMAELTGLAHVNR